MNTLLNTFQQSQASGGPDIQGIALYQASAEQKLLDVPFFKPTLIAIISGEKQLGHIVDQPAGRAGEFIFFADSPGIAMRNIPAKGHYQALLFEFEPEDFDALAALSTDGTNLSATEKHYFSGPIEASLAMALSHYIQWQQSSPKALWANRRREILQLLVHQGYRQLQHFSNKNPVSRRAYGLISQQLESDLSLVDLSAQLTMSESTLRRKLAAEDTSFQQLKDAIALGKGLHLLQSTQWPISQIALACGYQSQSRFGERFKQKFGLTPSELRKTRSL